MAAISTYLANEILNGNLPSGGTYLALHTEDPTAAGSGAEVSGGSYARSTIDTWGSISNGQVANDSSVAFADLPTCVVSHLSIWDASTAGNMLFYGALDDPISVTSGESLLFAVGDLTISII